VISSLKGTSCVLADWQKDSASKGANADPVRIIDGCHQTRFPVASGRAPCSHLVGGEKEDSPVRFHE